MTAPPDFSSSLLSERLTAKLGHVLIVDDEVELMTALCEMLAEKGYETKGLTSGQEALAVLQEQEFDVLLADLMMPGLDGVALLRAGLAIDPHLMGIIMTGQGTVQTAVEAMKVGAFDYVLKPFKLSALLPVLSRALQVRRLRTENVQLRETVAVYELNQAIAFTFDLNTIVYKVADAVLQQCEADEVSIMLLTRQGDELYIAAVRGEDREILLGERVPIDQGIAGWVARHRTPLTLDGKVQDPRFTPLKPRSDIRSALSLPMLVGNRVVGVLNVNFIHNRRRVTLGQVKALNLLTSAAAAAVESAALYQESEQLREFNTNIVATIAEGLALFDPAGHITFVNPSLQNLLGYTAEELVGLHWSQIVPLLDQSFVTTQRVQRVRGSSSSHETMLLSKGGQEIPVFVSASPFTQSGEFAGTLATFVNITERKRAEAALQEEAHNSAALARLGQELIALLDTPVILERLCQLTTEVLACDCSHVVLWQPGEETTLPAAGYGDTPEQWEVLRVLKVPGDAMADLFGQLEQKGVLQVTRAPGRDNRPEVLLLGAGVSVGFWMALRRGEKIVGGLSAGYRRPGVSVTGQHERLAHGIAQLASLALANAKLFEELEQANQLKSDFLATMSHELRTPLNVVVGYTDLLLDGTFGDLMTEQSNALERVRRAAYGEVELINTILDVSRLEEGRLPVALTDVDVVALMAELRQETEQKEYERPGVTLVWQAEPTLPRLYTDRTKLKIVLKNLLDNALKFTEHGSITVDARAAGEGIEFSVADTGIGITPDIQAVMFEMFRRGDSSTTSRYGGSGLGLYIVRRMLELLGGTVTVESEVGRGSTFWIGIPTSPRTMSQ